MFLKNKDFDKIDDIYNIKKPDDTYKLDDRDTKMITLELDIFRNCNKSIKAVKYISDILFKIFKNRQYYSHKTKKFGKL